MKKLLLSALCAVTTLVAGADTATWDFIVAKTDYTSNLKSPTTLNATSTSSEGKWTFTYVSSATSSNNPSYGPTFGSGNNPVSSGTFALADSKIPATAIINKVVFTVRGSAKGALSSWNLTIGGTKVGETQTTTENSQSAVVTELTWDNINAVGNQITFTLAKESTKGFHLQGVSITYTTGGPVKEQAGLSFPEASYTVEFGQEFTKPALTNPNSLTVSYESSKPEVATVDATTGEVTIVGGGTTTISAKSAETDTYYAGNASYELTVEKKVASFEEIYAQGQNVNIEVAFPMVVTYVNGDNCYVQRLGAEDYSLLYSSALTYKVGDVIPAGWTCTYSPYGNLPEIKPATGTTMPESTETAEVTYAKVSNITEADANRIVVIENVTFAAATPSTRKESFTGTVNEGTETVNFYVNFNDTPSVAAGAYDVTCAVSTYSATKLQAYPISYAEHVATSISEVVAEGKQSGELFDLQGRRVLTPRKGMIYIQSGKKIRF